MNSRAKLPVALWVAMCAVSLSGARVASADVLGYWPFDDPGDPAVTVDGSGNGNDGVINGATYTGNGEGFSGNPGDYALEFLEGSGASVEIESATSGAFNSLANSNAFTISLWMFGSDAQPLNQVVIFSGDPTVEDGTNFQINQPWSDGNVYYDTGGCCDGATQRISGPPPAGTLSGGWSHWVYVKDGDYKAAYSNGVKFIEGMNTNPLPEPLDGLWLGGHPDPARGYAMDGLLDDVIIFDEAMTDTADGSSRIALNQAAEPGSGVHQLFTLGAASFVEPGLNVSANLATVDETSLQVLIEKACNESQSVTYTIVTSDTSVLALAGDGGSVTQSAAFFVQAKPQFRARNAM